MTHPLAVGSVESLPHVERQPCGGGCGRQIPRARFACALCLVSLPEELRYAVQNTQGRPLTHQPRAQAVADALTHFRIRREDRRG